MLTLIQIKLTTLQTGPECTRGCTNTATLTEAPRFLAAPVGGGGVSAGQHAGALQLVTSQAGEEGLPSRVEPAHGHIAVGRTPREIAAQHES